MGQLETQYKDTFYQLKLLLKWLIISLVYILVSACEEYDYGVYSSDEYHKYYYDNGKLKKIQQFSDKYKEDGLYMFFYPNGVLKDSGTVINDAFIGNRRMYYDTGNLKKINTYFAKKIRSGESYYNNGNRKFYQGFNYRDELMYYIEYDTLGNLVKEEDVLFYTWDFKDNYPLNRKLRFELLVPNMEGYELTVDIRKKNGKEFSTIGTLLQPDEYNRIMYSTYFDSKNDLILNHIANLYSNNTLIKSDTLEFLIEKGTGKASYTHSNDSR